MLPPSLSKADLHLLYVFSAVVEARGFAAAQIELNVSPSTISRQISDLEIRMGMKLCDRGRSGFRLTDKGQVVYRAAQRLFAAAQDFRETIDGTRGKLVGHLSVALIDNWVFHYHSPVRRGIEAFVKTAPEVSIELFSMAPDDIEIAVQDSRVAFGVGVFHKPKPGLVYEQLCFDRTGLYCARGHPLFAETDIDKIHQGIQRSKYAKRAYLNEQVVAPVSRSLDSNASAHQVEGIAYLILTGEYIGYLPEYFADYWTRQDKMKSVGNGHFDQNSEIQFATKRGTALNLVSETLKKLISKAAS